MLYDFGPRLLKLRKDKNLTQQMVVERAKGFDPKGRKNNQILEPKRIRCGIDWRFKMKN